MWLKPHTSTWKNHIVPRCVCREYSSAPLRWILMVETKIWAQWHTKMQWSRQSQKNSWSYFCCNKLSKVQKIISPSIFPPRLWQQTILNFWAMSLGFLKTRFISKILNWKRILQKYSKLSNQWRIQKWGSSEILMLLWNPAQQDDSSESPHPI